MKIIGSYLLIHFSLLLNLECSYASKDSQKETRNTRDMFCAGSYLLIHLSLSLDSDCSYASMDSQKETRDPRDVLCVAI